jgi:PD-(D/E)XK endonuclease
MKNTTYDRGNISESIVMSAYLRAGFPVAIPFGAGVPYDLIVDASTGLYRIQLKRDGSVKVVFFTKPSAECGKHTLMQHAVTQNQK